MHSPHLARAARQEKECSFWQTRNTAHRQKVLPLLEKQQESLKKAEVLSDKKDRADFQSGIHRPSMFLNTTEVLKAYLKKFSMACIPVHVTASEEFSGLNFLHKVKASCSIKDFFLLTANRATFSDSFGKASSD